MIKTTSLRGQHQILISLLSLTVLLGMVGALALAQGATATLTIAKVSTPAGGQDFPISAVGAQSSLETTSSSPVGVDQDHSGLLYVVSHRTSEVEVFDTSGNQIALWGVKGKDAGQLFRPDGLSVYDSGTDVIVYVADTGSNRVEYFTGAGDYIGGWGGTGTADGQFDTPQALTVTDDQTVYVADTWNHRIQVFSGTGDFIRSWGTEGTGDGEFSYPAGVALDESGNVYVSDSNNHRIQVFDNAGQYLRQWGSTGDAPGELYFPTGITVGDGFILVSDTYNDRIQKFTPEGVFVAQWGEEGTGEGQFTEPRGITFDHATGLTYVADNKSGQVDVFAQHTFVLSDGETTSADFPAGVYNVTEAPTAPWTLDAVTCDVGQPTPIDGGVQITLLDSTPVSCTFENLGEGPTTYSVYLGYIAADE